MLLLCSCHPTRASAVLYSSPVWQQRENKKGSRVHWEMSFKCSCLCSVYRRGQQTGMNKAGFITSSASSRFGSSQERLRGWVLNAPAVFQAKQRFTPRITLCRAAENWQTPSPSAEAAGRAFSSLPKHRCLLLKSALEEEGNPSMTPLFLIKILLEMSPWRRCLGLLKAGP